MSKAHRVLLSFTRMKTARKRSGLLWRAVPAVVYLSSFTPLAHGESPLPRCDATGVWTRHEGEHSFCRAINPLGKYQLYQEDTIMTDTILGRYHPITGWFGSTGCPSELGDIIDGKIYIDSPYVNQVRLRLRPPCRPPCTYFVWALIYTGSRPSFFRGVEEVARQSRCHEARSDYSPRDDQQRGRER